MSTRKNECKKDAASYKAITERWAKNKTLKSWFQGLSDVDRVDWFRRQHTLSSGSKRRFDEVSYTETSHKSTGQDDTERDHYQPYSEFLAAGLLRNESIATIEEAWKDIVEAPGCDALFVRGQWCVPKFVGVFRDKVSSIRQNQDIKRQKFIHDSDELTSLFASGSALLQNNLDNIKGAKTKELVQAPTVDCTVADKPVTAPVPNLVLTGSLREVIQLLICFLPPTAHRESRVRTLPPLGRIWGGGRTSVKMQLGPMLLGD